MKKLLVAALLGACIIAVHSHAGEKFMTFSGNVTYCNDENRSLVARNNRKEISFFVAGSIFRGDDTMEMQDLSKGCSVLITYQKNKHRYIANRVDVKECNN